MGQIRHEKGKGKKTRTLSKIVISAFDKTRINNVDTDHTYKLEERSPVDRPWYLRR